MYPCFAQSRASSADPTIVARVWMGQEAIPFFTPLRLRAVVYDAYSNNTWLQTRTGTLREMPMRRGSFRIAKPVGFTRTATLQQRLIKGGRLNNQAAVRFQQGASSDQLGSVKPDKPPKGFAARK